MILCAATEQPAATQLPPQAATQQLLELPVEPPAASAPALTELAVLPPPAVPAATAPAAAAAAAPAAAVPATTAPSVLDALRIAALAQRVAAASPKPAAAAAPDALRAAPAADPAAAAAPAPVPAPASPLAAVKTEAKAAGTKHSRDEASEDAMRSPSSAKRSRLSIAAPDFEPQAGNAEAVEVQPAVAMPAAAAEPAAKPAPPPAAAAVEAAEEEATEAAAVAEPAATEAEEQQQQANAEAAGASRLNSSTLLFKLIQRLPVSTAVLVLHVPPHGSRHAVLASFARKQTFNDNSPWQCIMSII